MLTRRSFLLSVAAVPVLRPIGAEQPVDLTIIERPRVIPAATQYLREAPITITSFQSTRSAGGAHDYFSEGDYWWPDPENPKGPYIQKDGQTNPDNFVGHRQALIRLSLQVPALTAAWVLTKDRRYANHAIKHLRAWFIEERTLMNPSLLYAQAVKGRFTGRGVGIIDTLHLVEVARAITLLEQGNMMSPSDRAGVRAWFDTYLTWMNTHEYGKAERDAKNNHGTCWALQAAEYARLLGRRDITSLCKDRYKTAIVPGQIAPDGSFPEELKRTKPYGYSLFNLDAIAGLCQVLSTEADNLWQFETKDGRSVRKALAFMVPFITNKASWKYPKDVMYFDEWPMRHCSLLFGGVALNLPDYVELWKKLPADSPVEEVIRNFFIRQPLLWVS
jgi:Alginate lyase